MNRLRGIYVLVVFSILATGNRFGDLVVAQSYAQGINLEASPAFAVSGFVRDAEGAPVQGALISSDGLKAQTNSEVFYQLDGLTSGEHIISAGKIGWITTPETQIVAGPPDVGEINFTTTEYNENGIEMLSINSIGEQARNATYRLDDLSDDGRFALFFNCSDNITAEIADFGCLFRRDRLNGTTESVLSTSYPPYGDFVMGNYGDMSADGSVVVFTHGEPFPPAYPNDFYPDLFIRDYADDSVTRIYAPDGFEFDQGVSGKPQISGNGDIILFKSSSTNLMTGNTWNEDLYLYDRVNDTYTRVTERQSQDGYDHIGRTAMSTDGRYVLFSSLDTSFAPESEAGKINVYRYDRIQDTHQLIYSYDEFDLTEQTDINLDGRYIVIMVQEQVYVYDSLDETFRLVSQNAEGVAANGVTVDGAISDDGRYVLFASEANNLVPNAPAEYWGLHLYLADLEANTMTLVDSGIFGEDSNGNAGRYALITSNGRFVGFTSEASNLVVGDENGSTDAFLKVAIADADGDADGIDSQVEDGAPNNGDGNNDGVPDSEQASVASLPNSVDSQYVTLEAPAGTSLQDVVAGDNPDPGSSPEGVDFPVGLLSFSLTGLSNGAGAAVTLIPEGGVTSTTYYKYGPTPDNRTDNWYEFLYDGTTGAEIFADRIVLHFVDGLRGDGDLEANGTIVEPGGPAYVNQPPTIDSLIVPDGPVDINEQPVAVEVVFTDPEAGDTHEVTWNWGDGSSTDVSSGAVSPAMQDHTYEHPGTYIVEVTVTDQDGASDSETIRYVVIYDPDGGFVTGGGWINSPEGAYTLEPSLTGMANFGFVSKYKKGADTPTGNTEFQFKAGDLNFHSGSYDWLVVAGAKAMFKGTGTINGSGNYGFLLSAVDAALTPSTDTDLFRIKIWDKENGDEVVYDNQPGSEEDAPLTTSIGGGNIMVKSDK